MSSAPARVGFIGLGSQGAPMAHRIIAAGHKTTLWARRPATLAPFADSGAETARSPAELATLSDLVCLCVVDDADVEQVVTGPDGVLAGLRRGGVIAIHSTVHPDTCRRLEASARTCGVSVVDAPVSGGGRAAEQGSLVVMAGGDPQVFAYCRPVFATYGDPVVHLGPTGSGQLAKILNNLLFTAHLGLASQVLGLGATSVSTVPRWAGYCHAAAPPASRWSGSPTPTEAWTASPPTRDPCSPRMSASSPRSRTGTASVPERHSGRPPWPLSPPWDGDRRTRRRTRPGAAPCVLCVGTSPPAKGAGHGVGAA